MMFRAFTCLLVLVMAVAATSAARGQTLTVNPRISPVPEKPETAGSPRQRRMNEQLQRRRSQMQLRNRAELSSDLAHTRREIDRLTKLHAGASAFFAGGTESSAGVAVRSTLAEVAHLETVSDVLKRRVPPLLPPDFLQARWREMVESDGRLVAPPRSLRGVEGYDDVKSRWGTVADEVREDLRASDAALDELERAAERWTSAARRSIAGADFDERQTGLA